MPNWCMTSYVIVGTEEEVAKIRHAVINHPVMASSDTNWQGNILNALGLPMETIKRHSLRGFLYNCECKSPTILQLDFEEAWSRTDFAECLEALFPDTSIYWIAEEPSCAIYQTNDSEGIFFPDRYIVGLDIEGDLETEYFTTLEEALTHIFLRTKCKSKAEINAFNDMHKDTGDSICLHRYEIV